MPSDDDIPLSIASSGLIGKTRLHRSELRRFLGELTARVTRGRAIACLVTSDAELRRLNRTYRRNDYATDVLSFRSAAGNGFAGDLAISIDRARAQAAQHGHSLEDELRILMLHGALHLAGMDHEKDSGEMARAEARWRRRLGLPPTLIERIQK
ncbi:MAG TPA: rRNA maturation RNase YbeY [Bryobacteraceae bacterium]|nr:rRNA maturation RNase YbeY [Bryobacteraceae bacterium]